MEITKVDLRELDPSSPGWGTACAAVAASMVEHGCVIIAQNAISPELRQALFSRARELFALPVETKLRNAVSADGTPKGYIRPMIIPGWDYESLEIRGVNDTRSVSDFSNLLWPQGNPKFCDTMVSFVSNVVKLELMVEKMTLYGLGVREENIVAHHHTLTHNLRFSRYGVPEDSMGVALPTHTDPTFLTAILQHEVGGLEVEAKDGSWISIPAEPDTITIMSGDLFTVLTNGKVPACVHRVIAPRDSDRFSVLCGSEPKNGIAVSATDEFVGQKNPLKYKPVKPDEYMQFRYSEKGAKSSNPLKELYGVQDCGSTE